MDLQALEYFVEVSQAGGFSTASAVPSLEPSSATITSKLPGSASCAISDSMHRTSSSRRLCVARMTLSSGSKVGKQ